MGLEKGFVWRLWLMSIGIILILMGLFIGFLVGLIPIGSGPLFTLAMIFLYKLSPEELVGADTTHALLLVTATGILHTGIGNVNFLINV